MKVYQNNQKLIRIFSLTMLLAALLMIILSINVVGFKKDQAKQSNAAITYFRSFKLTGPADAEFSDADIKAHSLTIVNGWAPWCGPCVGEMPDLNELAREYEGQDVQIIGIVADYLQSSKENPDYDDEIQAAVQSTGVEYPILFGNEEFHEQLQSTILGYPTTWAVDREGRVLEIVTGSRSKEKWQEMIGKWIEEASK